MLYANFESILKPVAKQYIDKMNKIETERKGKVTYTERINTYVPSGWCTQYVCIWKSSLSLKMVLWKRLKEHTEDEVKRLYATFHNNP